MLLTLDIGNTSIKTGLFDNGKLTWCGKAPDAFALRRTLAEIPRPQAVAACSVRPQQNEAVRTEIIELFDLPVLFLGEELQVDIKILIDRPETLSADRKADAIAAYHHAGRRVIVADFGTAIAFDVISDAGEFIGGAIAAGVALSLEALHDHTALLPHVEPMEAPAAIGRNTEDAILAGVCGGLPGLVDRVIENIQAEYGGEFTVYATGTDSTWVATHCRTVQKIIPDLTLEGLYLAWKKSSEF